MAEQTKNDGSVWATFPIEREVVISRVVDADIETAFQAWVNPSQIVQWFGPDGFSIETHEIDIRTGGMWRFDMIAPDGTRYTNRMKFSRIEPPRLLEVNHGKDVENDPESHQMLIIFDQQDNGKTVVTLRQMHATKERRDFVVGFGAVEYGNQTLGKLANHISTSKR